MNNRNSEGYVDPTAYYGMKEVVKQESKEDAAVHRLIHHIRYVSGLAGFEVTGRITFKHKESGRVFK